jgi:hypothetical protein
VNALAGPGEAAGIDHRNETAQKLEVKHGAKSFYFRAIYISTDIECII